MSGTTFLLIKPSNALWLANSSDETQEQQRSATVAALIGIGPRDELEGMIAAQLIAAHNAAMECYRRAMIERTDVRRTTRELEPSQQAFPHLCHAARGAQPSSRQGPAEGHGRARPCARWRAGCRRHGRDPGGRGSDAKSEDQPHAKQITHAPQPAMWSADEKRKPVPVAGDAERPMPNARRNVARRSKG